MFTQTPVGGRRLRNQRQLSKVVSGDRPAAPLPSSGASPSFSYGSPSIDLPDIPTLHDTTVSLASALSTAQRNAQKKDYINPNLNTHLKQPKFLKEYTNKHLFSSGPNDMEYKKRSQTIIKESKENSDSVLNNEHFQGNLPNFNNSGDYFEENFQSQDIKRDNKITRYYLRESNSIDGNSRISLNYDPTNNSMNPENLESQSYEEEELLYTQLNENDFKDFFDEIDYEYSISDDENNPNNQEYLEDSDYEKSFLEKNFVDSKWFNISYFRPKYNFSFPQNTDELMQHLMLLEKTIKNYESMAQDILKDKKNIFKAIKEIDVKRSENFEITKSIKKELDAFRNSFEKIKKEVSDIKLQDNKRDSKINNTFDSLSLLQRNISKYENWFINHEESLKSFDEEVINVKRYVDRIYQKFTNSQIIFKNDLNDKYITEKIINILEYYLPSQLVVKINPKTGKIDINPEFWILLREIFPDRVEINSTLKASFSKNSKNVGTLSFMSWSNFLKTNEENIKTFIKSQTDEDLKKNQENGLVISKTYFVNTLRQSLKKIQDDLDKDLTTMRVQINDQFKKLDYTCKNKIQLTHSDHLKSAKSIRDKEVETLIETALHKYSSDILARPDFALYSSGARINPFLTSSTYLQRPTKFIPNLLSKIFWDIGCTWGYPPAMAIHHENNVGMCWAFPGSIGQISIRLSEAILLTDVTIEHVDSKIAHDVSTAPRDVELWVQVDDLRMREKMIQQSLLSIKQSENNTPPSKSYVLAATMTYNIFSLYPIQTFPIPVSIRQLSIPIENVIFRIISNWGNSKFTCLYRVRVHGTKSFIPYVNQIAGHAGVLSDVSGEVICKPCTAAEIDFYISSSNYPVFQRWMPTYIGNLMLNPPTACSAESSESPNTAGHKESGKLGSGSEGVDAIVLENLCYPFVRPSMIDIKLGKRLWDNDASLEKRERLEWVSKHTTSGSLGFRISAMQLWCARDGIYQTYSKEWGKSLTLTTVGTGLRTFLSATETVAQKSRVVSEWIDSLSQIQNVLRDVEVRLYSSSLFFVYESDPVTLAQMMDKDNIGYCSQNSSHETNDTTSDNNDHVDNDPFRISVCRLIDFAHAHWVFGQGPDENVLHGITSLKAILKEILTEYCS
ncbi:hypothetical protein PMAC_002313 [Pneumocystis sp. 'macacae']|nr:hypothetical protein PMAC_002313 [Pneumocystis sp. 'macacae']